MLPFVKSLDWFKSLPKEFTNSSVAGGIFSLLTFILIVWIFFCESYAYLFPPPENTIMMNNDQLIQSKENLIIEYNVTMYNIACQSILALVYDPLTEGYLPMKHEGTKRSISHDGIYGETQESHHTDVELRNRYLAREDANWSWNDYKRLSRDWVKSDEEDINKNNFGSLHTINDAVIVNFYASWSSECKKFAPIWMKASETGRETKFTDGDGKEMTTNFVKINCVYYSELCNEQNIWTYPTVRVYRRDGKFEELNIKKKLKEDDFSETDVINWFSDRCRHTRHFEHTKETIINGCNLEGTVTTRRVPGEFHFQIDSKSESLEPSMTNVSHTIHKLTFDLADDRMDPTNAARIFSVVDPTVKDNINPLAGNTYIVHKKHQSFIHYLQVVSTYIQTSWTKHHVFQYTSQNSYKQERESMIPSAKFQYTISPMNVLYRKSARTFYQYLTTVCGIMGGAVAFCQILFSATHIVKKEKSRKRTTGSLDGAMH